MPKLKPSNADLVRIFGADTFSCDAEVVFCKACSKAFHQPRSFTIRQHIKTKAHIQAIERIKNKDASAARLSQQLLTAGTNSGPKNDYNVKLVRAFMSADIPLYKTMNPILKEFLEESSSMKVLDRSTLQKNYVPPVYESVLRNIRKAIGDSKIWVSIDETTDRSGRHVANVVVGKLEQSESNGSYLLLCESLEKTNATTVAHVFVQAMELLWDGKIRYERVLVFVTDAARYMSKAASSLRVLFDRMIHVTCLAHAMHRVAEQIRVLFPRVDQLVANTKMILLKAPSRVSLFKEKVSLTLPPKPILTRWGTWLEAVEYYAANFDVLKEFVCNELDAEDAVAISLSQSLFKDPSVRAGVVAIASNFSAIPRTIEALEKHGASLEESTGLVEELAHELSRLPSSLRSIHAKFEKVVGGNSGFTELCKVRNLHRGETRGTAVGNTEDLLLLKYAPIVSCEVERTFSQYKTVFRDNRHSLLFDNLKKYVIVACNQTLT